MDKPVKIRRKISISVTLSPNLVNQIDKAIESGDFAGQSDIVSQALSEFFVRYYRKGDISEMKETVELVVDRVLETRFLYGSTDQHKEDSKDLTADNNKKVVIE